MDCSDVRDDLLDVLYGEADAETRQRLQTHQRECSACRDEFAAMQRLRRDLAEWRAPGEPSSRPAAPSLWARLHLPRGLAAAAVLLLAAGGAVGLSGVEVQFEKGPVKVRVGRGGQEEELKRLLAQEERRRRDTAPAAMPVAQPEPSGAAAELVLRRVEGLIRESEARQTSFLRAGLLELSERTEAQRRYDLARVSAGLSYLDGKTGQQVARTTELMGYVLQASQKR